MKYDIHNLPLDFEPNDYDKRTLEDLSKEILGEIEDYRVADYYGDSNLEVQGVIITNWNDVDITWQDILLAYGYDMAFPDEVVVCSRNKAWQIYPSNYGMNIKWMLTEGGEIITTDDSDEEWIYACEIISPVRVQDTLPSFINEESLIELGYKKHNDQTYLNGMHTGMDDDPNQIIKELFLNNQIEAAIVRIIENSQFYVEYDIWVKPYEG